MECIIADEANTAGLHKLCKKPRTLLDVRSFLSTPLRCGWQEKELHCRRYKSILTELRVTDTVVLDHCHRSHDLSFCLRQFMGCSDASIKDVYGALKDFFFRRNRMVEPPSRTDNVKREIEEQFRSVLKDNLSVFSRKYHSHFHMCRFDKLRNSTTVSAALDLFYALSQILICMRQSMANNHYAAGCVIVKNTDKFPCEYCVLLAMDENLILEEKIASFIGVRCASLHAV